MKVRKQIYELSLADLDEHPVWEFALGEEGVEGQDEATVRPLRDALGAKRSDTLIVRASFVLADGGRFRGYIYAQPSGDTDIGGVQPAIIVDKGQVHFWHGMLKPSRLEMDNALAMLGRSAEQIFPLTFESDDKTLTGELKGFMFLDRDDLQEKWVA